ncbi:MAG: aminomethyl-transferring glycine dehydrogenase subunit GcvPB [Rickettsiales bacterium]|nr:aminomethyl-transferring glycine dehydrogenase subunit GcvPB [Rickettsiales bacterium]
MTAALKKESNVTAFAKQDPLVDRSHGLNFEEPLLIERSREGRCGVDLPKPKGTKLRTGQTARTEIGLPQVSEPQAVRHFVRYSQQNFSIDSGFYPLGSCTMKHNPRLNEKMARLPGLANLHPLQDERTTQGALELMYTLQHWLSELTGLPGVSLCPAAGAQGEMAGMMVIRKALEMRGENRKTVLVPDSAHGTNPSTAAMCGFKIVTLPSTNEGFVDMEAFEAALNDDVAGFMLTNPNTCGLFDPNVKKIADMLHAAGGYFYCDGANFNAIAGRVRPADFGVDVMHINLHKTFSTPHGGGGPGSGPIVVTEELKPYLPVPRVLKQGDTYTLEMEAELSMGRMKGFHGHMGMFVRALSYMMAHGKDGIRQASEDAVLNANYVRSQLQDHYHVPFPGMCMHECLISDKIQKADGVTTMDIAKTLIEHGMHPMTVFFPLVVQGAMLIEPTESETKETIDRFIAIMKMIADDTKAGKGEAFTQNPKSTPRRRLDEAQAARKPILSWQMME